jgi:hypothetical protein
MPARNHHYKINTMARPLKRYELIELPIPAGSGASKFNFPDIPQLRDDSTQDIIIRAIDCFNIVSMPLTPAGNVTASLAQVLNSFLVLYIKGEESVHWLPLVRLQMVFQNGAGGTQQAVFEETQLANLKIDWTKSYIWAAAPYASETAFSFMFGFEYDKLPPGTIDKMERNMAAQLAAAAQISGGPGRFADMR